MSLTCLRRCLSNYGHITRYSLALLYSYSWMPPIHRTPFTLHTLVTKTPPEMQAFLFSKHCIPWFLEQGHGGSIIHIGSVQGQSKYPSQPMLCPRTLCGVGALRHCSRSGTPQPSIYADARYIDAVVVSTWKASNRNPGLWLTAPAKVR